MMGRGKKSSASSSPSFTPGEYIEFLEAKVQRVRSDTANANPPTIETTGHVFSEIDQCTMVELGKIIKASPVKSCELDPIPTFLLLEFLVDLLPFSSHGVQFLVVYWSTANVAETSNCYTGAQIAWT